MEKVLRYLMVCLLASSISGCASEFALIEGCEKVGELTPICEFRDPEDIVAVPDTSIILVSEMGELSGKYPGRLSAFDTVSGKKRVLFKGVSDASTIVTQSWGSSTCPGIPRENFSPHGFDLVTRADNRLQLVVVNHGGRETVEFFEVHVSGGKVDLTWQGCVPVSNNEYMNDVAGLSDGGFIASSMFEKTPPIIPGVTAGMVKSMLGFDTGYLFEWHQATGFTLIPGSKAPFMNGVSISHDEKYVFGNVYAGNEIRKINRETGFVEAVVDIVRPDNANWDNNGRLLVASHTSPMSDMSVCMDRTQRACPIGFSIVRIDPETMETETIFEHSGAPMGAATTAAQIGDDLYLGSYAGDRIVRMPYGVYIKGMSLQ